MSFHWHGLWIAWEGMVRNVLFCIFIRDSAVSFITCFLYYSSIPGFMFLSNWLILYFSFVEMDCWTCWSFFFFLVAFISFNLNNLSIVVLNRFSPANADTRFCFHFSFMARDMTREHNKKIYILEKLSITCTFV